MEDENNDYDSEYAYETTDDINNNLLKEKSKEIEKVNGNSDIDLKIDIDQKKHGMEIISKEEIMKERDKVINEAMEFLYSTKERAVVVLIYYKWAFDKLKTFWYDDPDTQRVGLTLSQETISQLSLNQVISDGDYCSVCNEAKNKTFDCLDCKHQFCKDCWEGYLNEKVMSSYNILKITCPQKGCSLIVYESLFEKYLNDINKPKYRSAVFKDFVSNSSDIKKCPNPSCSFYAKNYDQIEDQETEVNCTCGTIFCFKCAQKSHQPCSCYINAQWKNQMALLSADCLWIKSNSQYRQCPICNQAIEELEKIPKCIIMECKQIYGGCGHSFCFECEAPWATHDSNIGKCSRRQQEIDFNKQNREKYWKKYQIYSSYWNKVSAYYNRLKELENINFVEFIKRGIVSSEDIQIMDLDYISNGFAYLIKGLRALMYSHILSFYLSDEKGLYHLKLNQTVLEKELNNYSQCVSLTSILALINIQTLTEFKEKSAVLKEKILNNNLVLKYINILMEDKPSYLMESINHELLDNYDF